MNRIEISIDDQTLRLIRPDGSSRVYPISSARKGVGYANGSFRTPTGRFAIAEKIGGDAPARTIFRKREATGVWDGSPQPEDLILSRILWLDGLDPDNADTRRRFIYLHGTNHEDQLGRPGSQGCIRMANADIIELFDEVETGASVIIHPPARPGPNLIFFDCDSTLSSIEGIDELARARGPEVFKRSEALTNAAMNGEVPISEVFPRRLDMIQPDRELCESVARLYIETLVPGAAEAVDRLRAEGWMPIILSGGFAPLIHPLADLLSIPDVEAVPLHLDEEGRYLGFDATYPTTRNGGKSEIIREWRTALLPEKVVMVGDGISDLETRDTVDLFVGFGGVIARDAVRRSAEAWITSMADLPPALRERGLRV